MGQGQGAQDQLKQIAFKTPAPALTAQVNCAYAYAAASHADARLAEHFQKQNALQLVGKRAAGRAGTPVVKHSSAANRNLRNWRGKTPACFSESAKD
ncbi:hypothetical protein [Desulfocurvibacter africanus]|uniref:hypothetical protein n=1 Tax=Desulfocurvibacter africanus TaxID=873 RepID=UPI001182DE0B|nr:hypothetical protein [Desulfocurvibacter africanus]